MSNALLQSNGNFRPMMRLALPVLAEETLNLLVGYTDWWLMGHYLDGAAYTAAMGLMAYVLWLVPSMFAAASIGATAMVSRFTGAGNRRMASRVANQAMLAGLVLAVVGTIGLWLFGRAFLDVMQLEPEAAEHAWTYLLCIIPVTAAIMVEQVGAACLRGAGDTLTGMMAKTIVNVVNIFVSASLVTGWGPFPQLGWLGLAIGTAVGHGIGGLILLVVLMRGRAGLRLRWLHLRPNASIIRRLLKIGLPGGIDIGAILVCHLIYVAIINRLGTEAAAAHGLGVTIEAMAYLPGAAFQVAAATMVGQFLGAGDPKRAVSSACSALAGAGAIMSLAALACLFQSHRITTFFTGDPADPTGLETARLLTIVAFSIPSLAVVQVMSGALRGAGDTRWPLLITLVGFLGIRIPGAIFLTSEQFEITWLGFTVHGYALGVAGAWYAMVADVILRSILLAGHFWRGSWKKVQV